MSANLKLKEVIEPKIDKRIVCFSKAELMRNASLFIDNYGGHYHAAKECWLKINNDFFFVKKLTHPILVFNELLATEVGKEMGLDIVDYSPGLCIEEPCVPYVVSKNFRKEGYDYYDAEGVVGAPIEDYYNNLMLIDYIISKAMDSGLIKDKKNSEELKKDIMQMIVFDFLIRNNDREIRNFQFKANEEGLRLAPIFDSERSFCSKWRVKNTFFPSDDPTYFRCQLNSIPGVYTKYFEEIRDKALMIDGDEALGKVAQKHGLELNKDQYIFKLRFIEERKKVLQRI